MAWALEFRRKALDALEKMDRQNAARIVTYLETRVAVREKPWELGKRLHGDEFENIWRFRVGDYRILAEIKKDVCIVLVISVGNRREIYR